VGDLPRRLGVLVNLKEQGKVKSDENQIIIIDAGGNGCLKWVLLNPRGDTNQLEWQGRQLADGSPSG
jgi:hypothetical protein